jgi:hypothetical protein
MLPNHHEDCCSSSVSLSSSGAGKSQTHDVGGIEKMSSALSFYSTATTSQFDRKEQRLNIRRLHALILLAGGAFVAMEIMQLHAYIVEYQGPLDHIASTLVEPYYDMFCPKFSNIDETLEDTYDHINQPAPNLLLSWDCKSIGPTIEEEER